MRHLVIAIGLATCGAAASAQPGDRAIDSYLYEPSYGMDCVLRGKPVPYLPQPGDVMLATDKNLFWKVTHDLALAFEPHGSAIVVARSDGRLAILEAGPNDTMRCSMVDMLPHLKEYADKGPVWIRKRKTPLTAEQSACLTAFAERQDGKIFALQRLGLQLTPFRPRGPLRTVVLGKPRGDIKSYYCSELVLEACVAAGLVNPKTTRPGATYPHDLFFDRSFNPYINRHRPLECDWHPPARWVDSIADCKLQIAN
ncbi:MAG: hypothetical protein HY289_03520 [Planctomycetes bacterium]|nr:hypothetical protein [Planctomycetota bacterium]